MREEGKMKRKYLYLIPTMSHILLRRNAFAKFGGFQWRYYILQIWKYCLIAGSGVQLLQQWIDNSLTPLTYPSNVTCSSKINTCKETWLLYECPLHENFMPPSVYYSKFLCYTNIYILCDVFSAKCRCRYVVSHRSAERGYKKNRLKWNYLN